LDSAAILYIIQFPAGSGIRHLLAGYPPAQASNRLKIKKLE